MVPKASGPLFRKSQCVAHRRDTWKIAFSDQILEPRFFLQSIDASNVTRVRFPRKQIRYNLEDLIFKWSFEMMKEVGIYTLCILGQRKLFSIMDLFRLPLNLDFEPWNTNVAYPRQGQSIGFPMTPFVWSYELYESHSRLWSRRLQDHYSENLNM